MSEASAKADAQVDAFMAALKHNDPIEVAMRKVMGWQEYGCEGVAFPYVYRAWMSHPAFQVAL